MKKIEAIIDPSKLQEVKNALTKIGIRRMTISKVDEFGIQDAHKEFYRGKECIVDVVKEFKIELMVLQMRCSARSLRPSKKLSKQKALETKKSLCLPWRR